MPTFPNARYLIPEADYRYFNPDNDRPRGRIARTDAGQARVGRQRVVSAASRARPHARIGAVAGRRPARRVRRRPDPLPLQLHRPDDPCAFDEDLAAAAVTRKRVLTEASRRRAAVIPAHYPGHGGATVVARGDSFMVDDWLEITPI